MVLSMLRYQHHLSRLTANDSCPQLQVQNNKVNHFLPRSGIVKGRGLTKGPYTSESGTNGRAFLEGALSGVGLRGKPEANRLQFTQNKESLL